MKEQKNIKEKSNSSHFELIISKKVVKFISRLPSKLQITIRTKFNILRGNPFINPELDIKKMVGEDDTYRLRIGDYRFIYIIEKEKIIIAIIDGAHRKDIY